MRTSAVKERNLVALVKEETDKVVEFVQEYETRTNPVTRSVYRDMIRSRLDRIGRLVTDLPGAITSQKGGHE